MSFKLLAKYNQVMNLNIYKLSLDLPEPELRKNRGAFFQSIYQTLNHIAVADIIWLQRFSQLPGHNAALNQICALTTPKALDEPLCANFNELKTLREWLDRHIIDWTSELTPADMQLTLNYVNSKGQQTKCFAYLLTHFFNHQTHHRGQLSTLFSQLGIDVGVTDFLQVIPNEGLL